MNTSTWAAGMLCMAATALADPVAADETGSPDDTKAKERFSKLMEHAEGRGRTCITSELSVDRSKAAMEDFLKGAKFIDLDPGKPIRVLLPEGYYNPQGRTITFDEFEIAINQNDVSDPYISMTRTAEGLSCIRKSPSIRTTARSSVSAGSAER